MTDETPPKRKRGRPSGYKEEYAVQVFKYALLGSTNEQLARAFDVDTNTIDRWIKKYPEFGGALKKGREEADSAVSASLYRRAMGYSHDAVKIFADPKTGKTIKVAYVERYAPDVTACIFWLKNRQPDQWRDKHKLEHSGPNDGPIEVADANDVRSRIARRIGGIRSRLVGPDSSNDGGGSPGN